MPTKTSSSKCRQMTSFAATEAGEMPAYLFYPAADLAQDRIWKTTIEKWGEPPAETYIRGLHAHLPHLCKASVLWRRLPPTLVVPAHLAGTDYPRRSEHAYLFLGGLSGGRIGILTLHHQLMTLTA